MELVHLAPVEFGKVGMHPDWVRCRLLEEGGQAPAFSLQIIELLLKARRTDAISQGFQQMLELALDRHQPSAGLGIVVRGLGGQARGTQTRTTNRAD
jgi:hypothetical protein